MKRLRDRVEIQYLVATEGEYRDTESYNGSNNKSRRCDIKPLRAAESYQAAGESVNVVYEIRFRYERGLFTEKARLVDKRVSPNRVFEDLTIIDPGNMHTDILITATERRWPLRG